MSELEPSDSSLAVRLVGVSKIYRLYRKPLYRFLDLFGACPTGSTYFTEHEALAGVDVEVRRGEKVAIIGRNGAGKSTMLKVLTGLVKPSAGLVEVTGRISNLLQIGSGFHPDFTGRQNVFASLAHQGIVGRAASTLFEDIVKFSEIEEYIDQPMKTYSTGMCSRLMFSSSVIMTPDILVVDEILGVGDAYFAHKSFNRMRDLCENSGTTLLLVTHDIYSALSLCERFIWIDRGRVCFDGDGNGAIAMYENSVKAQEEKALRQRNAASLREQRKDEVVHVVVRSQSGFALSRPFSLGEIELVGAGDRRLAMSLDQGDERWHLMPESNLGDPETVAGRRCRSLRTFGSIYHKAEWSVQLPEGFEIRKLRARWHYAGDDAVEASVVKTDGTVLVRGPLPSGGGWQEVALGRVRAGSERGDGVRQVDYGTGAVRITAVQFFDGEGRPVDQVSHGEPLIVRVSCHAASPVPGLAVTFCVGFARQGFPYQAFIYDAHLVVPAAEEFVIESRLEELLLGSGLWYVNLAIGEPDIFDRSPTPYFAIDPAWYHLMTGRLEFRVLSVTGFDGSCFYSMPARIATTPIAQAAETNSASH
jgi:lipopolysaccharide transport system ATP-binding protein